MPSGLEGCPCCFENVISVSRNEPNQSRKTVKEISVGDGCDMHAVSSLVATQGRIYAVMWTRIWSHTDSSVWIARRVRTVARRGRVRTATSEEVSCETPALFTVL